MSAMQEAGIEIRQERSKLQRDSILNKKSLGERGEEEIICPIQELSLPTSFPRKFHRTILNSGEDFRANLSNPIAPVD